MIVLEICGDFEFVRFSIIQPAGTLGSVTTFLKTCPRNTICSFCVDGNLKNSQNTLNLRTGGEELDWCKTHVKPSRGCLKVNATPTEILCEDAGPTLRFRAHSWYLFRDSFSARATTSSSHE